jgi:hypothetical protein
MIRKKINLPNGFIRSLRGASPLLYKNPLPLEKGKGIQGIGLPYKNKQNSLKGATR